MEKFVYKIKYSVDNDLQIIFERSTANHFCDKKVMWRGLIVFYRKQAFVHVKENSSGKFVYAEKGLFV